MDIAKRFKDNPILKPSEIKPSIDGAVVECLLNPGAFQYQGRTHLLMRVAERMEQRDGYVSTIVADETQADGIRVVEFPLNDPKLEYDDARVFYYNGNSYLTTLSHLHLASSDDGVKFYPQDKALLNGTGELETFGIEDCRVTCIDGTYHLTYSAVSVNGVGIGLKTTENWKDFCDYGMIIPPHNKDAVLFEQKINDNYAILHRPVGVDVGGPYIWYAESPDLQYWGKHKCIARTRQTMWDSQRIGAGASPIKTGEGWLVIYHGADNNSRYCLGALLLDLQNPTKVLARSKEPIMEPIMEYEKQGFFGNVVFTNGNIVNGDTISLYYGASDEVICGAQMLISDILETLKS